MIETFLLNMLWILKNDKVFFKIIFINKYYIKVGKVKFLGIKCDKKVFINKVIVIRVKVFIKLDVVIRRCFLGVLKFLDIMSFKVFFFLVFLGFSLYFEIKYLVIGLLIIFLFIKLKVAYVIFIFKLELKL